MFNILTIGREYGSGGYEIGTRVAKELGFEFYDKALIADLADKIMVSRSFIESTDETPVKRNIFHEIFPVFVNDQGEQSDYIFSEQGKFIVQLAEKGNCVFIGRRADYYLRDNPNAFHIFCYADPDFRAARVSAAENCSVEEAIKKMNDMDKRRKTSYEYTTGRGWADPHNYDRMICTSTLGIDKCVEEIVSLMK